MRKKILAMILCFLVLPLTVLLTACGKAVPESVSISAKTTFEYGDEFTIGDDASFTVKMSKGDDIVVKAKDITIDYDSETKKAVAGDFEIDYSEYKANVLGTYEIKVSYTKAEDISAKYNVQVVAKTFADEDVTVSAEPVTYDGEAHSISVVCGIEGAVITYSTDGETYAETNPTFVNAGEYDVYFKVEKTGYEPPVTGTKKLTIAKKPVTISWTNTSFDYDGEAHKPTAIAGNVVEGDECIVTVVGEQTAAGTYTATVTALSNSNYALPTEGLTKEFTIAKVQVVIPAVSGSFTYDSTTKRAALTENEASKEFYERTGTTSAINASTYTVLYSLKDTVNYAWADGTTANKTFNWIISKANYSEFFWSVNNDYSVEYDGTEKEVTIYNLPTGVTASYTGNKATNAGTYTASAEFVYDTANYNAPTIANLRWTISKVNLTETDIAIPAVSVSRTVVEDERPTLSSVEIPDSHFAWSNPQASLYDVISDLERTAGEQISSFTILAIYTPDDEVNYNTLEVYVEIMVVYDAKTTLLAYEYTGEPQVDKDIAYTCPVVEFDGGMHFINVYVSATYTSGKAESAKITYFYASESNYDIDSSSGNKIPRYTSNCPSFMEAGTYVIYFKVELEGANIYQGYATLVITQAQIEFSNDNVQIYDDSSALTTDRTLDSLQVDLTYTSPSLTYRWETPNAYLKLGTNEYKLLIIPDDSNYKGTEIWVSITAVQGMIIKTYTLNGATMTIGSASEYKILPMEKGETMLVDFGTLLSGYVVCVYKDGEFVILQNNQYLINCNDEFYLKTYEFIIVPSDSLDYNSAVQRIQLIPQKPTYIEKFEAVVYQYGNYNEQSLLLSSSYGICGELYELRLVVSEGMTGEIYVDGKLYTGSFAGFEFNCDGATIMVIIKNRNGKVVKYNEFQIEFPLMTRIDDFSENLVSVTKKGETEQSYEYNLYNQVEITAKKDTFELKVFDTNRNTWADASFGDILVTKTLTVYKVLLTEGSYKIYQTFAILGTEPNNNEKSYKTEYSKGNIYGYTIQNPGYVSLDNGSYELDIDGLLDVNTIHVCNNNYEDVSGVIFARTENYLLVKIPVTVSETETQTYLAVLKIKEKALIDSNVSYVIGIANTISSNVEVGDIEGTEFTLDASMESILFKTQNPAARVACNSLKFDVNISSGIYIFSPKEVMENEQVTFTIFGSDGESSTTITLSITVEPIKLISFNPVVNENGTETEGESKELIQKKFAEASGDIFEGDITIDMMTETASVIDLKSHYTMFNENGEVWAEGDGDKYIKINFYVREDLKIALSIEDGQNGDFVQNLKGVLLLLDETEAIAKVNFVASYETVGLSLNCTLSLVEGEPIGTDVKLTLNYTEDEEQKSNTWTKSFDAYSDVLITGDYLTATDENEFYVGKFAGSNDRFYIDPDTNEIYAYINNEVGAEVLGMLHDSTGTYTLDSKEDGALEGIEIGTEFTFDAYDKKIYLACISPTQSELEYMMTNCDSINIEVTGNCKVYNVTRYKGDFVTDESEVQVSVPIQDDEFPFIMLKLVYNSGEETEFAVMLIIALIDLSEAL